MIPIKKPWASSPVVVTQAKPNPIWLTKLDFLAYINGTTIVNVMRGELPTSVGIVPAATPYGNFAKLDTSTDEISFPNASVPDYVENQLDFSIVFVAGKSAAPTTSSRLICRTENGASNHAWQFIDDDATYDECGFLVLRGGTQNKVARASRLSTTGYENVACTAKFVTGNTYTVRMWIDGTEYSASYTNSVGDGDDNTFFIGKRRAVSDKPWLGEIGMLGVFGRTLSPSEAQQLSINPWQIFEPRTIWIPTAAAAGSTPIHFRRHVGFSYG